MQHSIQSTTPPPPTSFMTQMREERFWEYPLALFLSFVTNLTRKFHELENQVEKVGILTEMFFVTSNFSSLIVLIVLYEMVTSLID